MPHLREYKKFFKYSGYIIVGTSAAWIYYQIRKTRDILENLLDTSVLDAMENMDYQQDISGKDKEFLDVEKFNLNNKKNALSRTWQSLKFSYARRLLPLASSDNKLIRIRAVKSLAQVHNLDNWHCVLLANMIDAKTAVGLARTTNSDKRFLQEPPLRYLTYNRNMLVNAMKELLVSLYERSDHPCIGYFISKIFVDDHDVARTLDHEIISLELNKFIQSASDVLPMCLESLLHHCSIEKYAKDMVELNGLPLLLEIHNRFKNNTEVSVTLCRILSYLSFHSDLLEPIFKSGWIGILAQWVGHEDIRISVPAARALANLDQDDGPTYSRCLYLLHPLMRPKKEHDIDVVFIHGLLGGVFFTWRQRNQNQIALGIIGKNNRDKKESLITETTLPKYSRRKIVPDCDGLEAQEQVEKVERHEKLVEDFEIVLNDIPVNSNVAAGGPYSCSSDRYDPNEEVDGAYTYCWPKDWLAKDCRKLRIIGINYDTSLSMWAPICPSVKEKFTLEERSDELMERLVAAGVGTKPIVWVTHSMGGLIVKNILCKAFESRKDEMKNICLNTKGLVFYSTPHLGSRLAKLNQATALLLWPSVEVQELRENSPQLLRIHKKFLDIVKVVPMKIITFVETKSTVVTAMKFNFLLVEPHSGDPGVGEYYEVPQDHLGICKPVDRYSFIYQKVLHLLKCVLNEAR